MSTILLLALSNLFLVLAGYGQFKYRHDWRLCKPIPVSWAIALLEYGSAVPAKRLGYRTRPGFQL